jgi:hypothetical protein
MAEPDRATTATYPFRVKFTWRDPKTGKRRQMTHRATVEGGTIKFETPLALEAAGVTYRIHYPPGAVKECLAQQRATP